MLNDAASQEWSPGISGVDLSEPHYRLTRAVHRCFEREPGRLQLRVPVFDGEDGICDVMVAEDDDCVEVVVIVCGRARAPRLQAMEWPVHIYLEQPLEERRVLDGSRGGAEVEQIDGEAFYAELQAYADQLENARPPRSRRSRPRRV